MKNTYTIKIAGNDYLFRVSKDENGIFIEFKRNDKLQSSTYLPLAQVLHSTLGNLVTLSLPPIYSVRSVYSENFPAGQEVQ